MLQEKSQTLFYRKLPLHRKKNTDYRSREYLAMHEVEDLMKAAQSIGRHRNRDSTLMLLMFYHGLRVSEAVNLKWEQLDFKRNCFHVVRLKGGLEATHPLSGREMRALRRIQKKYPENRYVFCNENKVPLSVSSAQKIVERAGRLAKVPFSIHPHMLRHSAGFYLANKGTSTRVIQGYLGHASISNTVRYTTLSDRAYLGLFPE